MKFQINKNWKKSCNSWEYKVRIKDIKELM